LIGSIILAVAALKAEEPTPVMFNDLTKDIDLTNAEPWEKPDFSHQEQALGY